MGLERSEQSNESEPRPSDGALGQPWNVPEFRLIYETIQFSPYVWKRDPQLPRQIAAAATAGFAGIGLDIWTIDHWLQSGQKLDSIVTELDRHGIPCIELQALAVDGTASTLVQAKRLAELASAFQPQVVMATFVVTPSTQSIELFARATDIITAHGGFVALEFLPYRPISDIATAMSVCKKADGQAGICVDTWHFFRGTDGWDDLASVSANDLTFVQFNDAPAMTTGDLAFETLHRRTLPGLGEFDLEAFRDQIIQSGYSGPISVEILSEPLREIGCEQFAQRAFDASRPFWNREE
jgi:sugar phosphate isomerase/epimerase